LPKRYSHTHDPFVALSRDNVLRLLDKNAPLANPGGSGSALSRAQSFGPRSRLSFTASSSISIRSGSIPSRRPTTPWTAWWSSVTAGFRARARAGNPRLRRSPPRRTNCYRPRSRLVWVHPCWDQITGVVATSDVIKTAGGRPDAKVGLPV
jgi:hypothetical protein